MIATVAFDVLGKWGNWDRQLHCPIHMLKTGLTGHLLDRHLLLACFHYQDKFSSFSILPWPWNQHSRGQKTPCLGLPTVLPPLEWICSAFLETPLLPRILLPRSTSVMSSWTERVIGLSKSCQSFHERCWASTTAPSAAPIQANDQDEQKLNTQTLPQPVSHPQGRSHPSSFMSHRHMGKLRFQNWPVSGQSVRNRAVHWVPEPQSDRHL